MRRFFITLACAMVVIAASAQDRRKLTVVIDNVGSASGRVMAGVYNKEKGAFEQESRFDGQAKPAVKGRVSFVFELPAGSYAIGAYHDVNNNGVLDKNWLGVPTEPYIMSGDRKMPNFKASLIKLDTDKFVVLKL